MSPVATAMLAGASVKLNGSALDAAMVAQLTEVRVDLHSRLADRCSLRLADPHLDLIDRPSFPLGADLQVALAGPAGSAPTDLFSGQVASLEPEFDAGEAMLVVRAYDRSHRLNRTRRTNAYQQMSYSDIAHRVITSAGLSAGTVDSSPGVAAFTQQTNETDWEFLWRLADEIGFEVHASGRQVHFRRAAPASGSPVRLAWSDTLLSFRPRVTAVQQVDSVTVRGWDPLSAQTIEATQTPRPAGAAIGIRRADAASALGSGEMVVADQPRRTSSEATALARSVAGTIAESFVEAEGVAIGDPALRPGVKIQVEGVGSRFGGTYALTSASHVFRTASGYETRFAISGRSSRSMLDLVAARAERAWRHGLVVGVVTNNQDPEALGRVRVRYPALGSGHEGWWARVVAPAAGARRGLRMTPQPGDEVLVAFEHDSEEHPYVVGSVWNGTAKPQELVHADGSFALRSDKQVLLEAAEAMSLTADKEITLSAAGNAKLTTNERGGEGPPGDVTVDAKGAATLKSGTSAKVQAGTDATLGGSTEVKISAGTKVTMEGGGQVTITGAAVQLQATGVVQISGAQIMLG